MTAEPFVFIRSINYHCRKFYKIDPMKKMLLSLLTLLLIHNSYAQVQWGVKGGLQVADLKFKVPDNNKTRAGIYAGGLLQFGLSDKIVLQPELLYAVKGYRFDATAFHGKGVVSFNYITLPLMAGYRATGRLTVMAGPEAGYLISARSKFDKKTVDISNNYENLDLGINLGLAYQLNVNLGIDLRYSHGVKPLMHFNYTDANGQVIGSGKGYHNRGMQLGLFFGIGH